MSLKHLFVIGDSISIQYGPFLKEFLEGTLRYSRKGGDAVPEDLDHPTGANGGDSARVLSYMETLRREQFRCDLLLLNCGLHDLRVNIQDQTFQVPPDIYLEHLRRIQDLAAQVSGKLLWVRTTPVHPDEGQMQHADFTRNNQDVQTYNQVADSFWESQGVPVLDLYGFTQTLGKTAFRDHAHFTPEACRLQAAFLAGALFSSWAEL